MPPAPPPPPPPPPPVAPVQVGTIPNQAISTGQSATLEVSTYFRDPDGGVLTYTVTSSAAGVVSVSLSGSTLTMVGVADGTATVTVTARDPDGLTAAQGFQVTVETPNRAPEAVGTIPNQAVATGSSETLNVSSYFRDPDGDVLTYTAASSSAAVVSISLSGSTLTMVGVADGTATVTVTARDPDGLAAAQGFQVTVETPNRAPEAVGTIPSQTIDTGSSSSPVDVSSYFRDPDGDALTYTAASSAPAVVTVSVSGSALTVNGVAAGTATVTVTARDPGGLAAAQGFEVTVETPNRAPEAVGTIPSQTIDTGSSSSPVDVSSYFRDPDGDALTYTAASSAPAVVTVSVSGSALTVNGVAAGTATVTVTARDPDGLTAAQGFQVTVETPNRAPVAVGTIPNQTVATGGRATVDVSSYFRDPDGDALTYTAATSHPAIATVAVSGSSVTISAVAAGTATVTVTARDPDGLTAVHGFRVTVETANRAPVAVGTIPNQTVATGGRATVGVSSYFRDPDGDALTYTAATSHPAIATVAVSGSSVTISAVAAGTATVTVTARDPDGLTAAQGFQVTVETPNRAPEAVGTIPNQTVATGETATATEDVSSYFRDPDGDELVYAATSSAPTVTSVSFSGSTLMVSGVAAGTAVVTVTARDPGGLTGTQRFGVTVRDAGGGAGVRDDFDSSASLDDWEVRNANAAVVNGTLRLTRTSTLVGVAERQLESPLADWTIRARMGSEADGQLVSVWWLTGNADYPVLAMTLGTIQSYNYTMWFFDAGNNDWRAFSDLIGHSSAVRTGAGEFTNITVGFEDRRLVVLAGDTQLIDLTLAASNRFLPAFTNVESVWLVNEGASSSASLNRQVGVAAGTELFGAPANSPFDETIGTVDGILLKTMGARNSTSLFDWVEVTGEASGGGGNRSPQTVGTIPAMTVTAGASENVNASSYFRDPDGDALTYTASSSRTRVATVSVSGRTVAVAGVAAGTATIRVTATDPGGLSAEQSFSVTVQGAASCTEDVGTIPSGTTVTRAASWDTSCSSAHYGGYYARYYNLTLAERLSVTIDLTSPSVDTWLDLRSGSGTGGTLIEADNNDGTGTNARINRTLAAGTYTIDATTRRAGATGPFTLTLAVGGGGGDDHSCARGQETSLAVGDSVGGVLTTGDQDCFRIDVAASGTLEVSTSGTTDTYGKLYDGSRTLLEEDDDDGASRNFLISRTVSAGTYYVEVSGYGGTATGSYMLRAGGSGGGGTRTYQTGETIETLPTGFWTPDVTSGASFQYSGGQVTITFNNNGYIEEAGVRYTCKAGGGCRVVDRLVTQGTIEASDGGGGGSNQPPEAVGSIPNQTIDTGSSSPVDVSSYFRDPDGDALTYTASSSRTSVATVRVSSSTVTVAGVAAGTATISVTATDPGGLSAVQTFGVTVEAGGGGAPDLVVQSPAVDDATPETGASFTFSATVRNRGDGQSASTTLRYYRSSNATISSRDTEVGTDAVRALNAGGTSDETIALTAPSEAGTYYYGACVDSVSGESATGNNCSDGVEVEVEGGGGGGREGECVQGATYGRGESCDVYGTGGSSSKLPFTVLSDGRARFGFSVSGNRIDNRGGSINGVTYHFLASHQGGGVWRVDEYRP